MVRATSSSGLKASLCWDCGKAQDCDHTMMDRKYGVVVTMCDQYAKGRVR